jgi:hypothetical protein
MGFSFFYGKVWPLIIAFDGYMVPATVLIINMEPVFAGDRQTAARLKNKCLETFRTQGRSPQDKHWKGQQIGATVITKMQSSETEITENGSGSHSTKEGRRVGRIR